MMMNLLRRASTLRRHTNVLSSMPMSMSMSMSSQATKLTSSASKRITPVSPLLSPLAPSVFAPLPVLYGNKCVEQISDLLVASKSRSNNPISKVLVVCDAEADDDSRTEYLLFLLGKTDIPTFTYVLPTDARASVTEVNAGRDMAKRVGADAVIAYGGGTVLDTSRAIAALLTNPGNMEDYVSSGLKALVTPAAPHYIISTNAGHGSELSTTSLIYHDDVEAKVSMCATAFVPEMIFIDPLLTMTVPEKQSIEGALTALGQCLESLFQRPSGDIASLCQAALTHLGAVMDKPLRKDSDVDDIEVMREAFALASLYSSAASQATGYGVAHAFGMAFSTMSSSARHTEVCAAFLPAVLDHYATLMDTDPSLAPLKVLSADLLAQLNAQSHTTETSLAQWVRHVSRTFECRTVEDLGFDAETMKFVLDRTTERLESTMASDPSSSSMQLARTNIEAILKSAVTLK